MRLLEFGRVSAYRSPEPKFRGNTEGITQIGDINEFHHFR